jgi:hypothetical protein
LTAYLLVAALLFFTTKQVLRQDLRTSFGGLAMLAAMRWATHMANIDMALLR